MIILSNVLRRVVHAGNLCTTDISRRNRNTSATRTATRRTTLLDVSTYRAVSEKRPGWKSPPPVHFVGRKQG